MRIEGMSALPASGYWSELAIDLHELTLYVALGASCYSYNVITHKLQEIHSNPAL